MSNKLKELSEWPTDRVCSTSRTLPIALLRARERVMNPIRIMLNEIGLTEQKWRILRTLEESGNIEQSEIARQACLLLSSLTRILRTMEADGQIKRAPDKGDKRRTIVKITPLGRSLILDNLPTSNQIYMDIEKVYGRGKLELLLDLLEDLQKVKI